MFSIFLPGGRLLALSLLIVRGLGFPAFLVDNDVLRFQLFWKTWRLPPQSDSVDSESDCAKSNDQISERARGSAAIANNRLVTVIAS